MSKATDPVDTPPLTPAPLTPAPRNPAEDRARVIAARNRVVGLLLACLVVLFFAITIVKIKI